MMTWRLVVGLSSFAVFAPALDNGMARTPPMAWSTWNAFHCHVNHTTLLEVADAMVKSGMVAAGYKSLNIDDCWPMKARDNKTGEIVPDPTKFPEGMAAFSKALARKGVALGIYTAHGPKTCQGFPGSLGYETIDAQTYASWNVVYVKNDYCWHHEPSQAKHLNAFNAMRDALNATGKGMVHSIHWNYGDTPGPACNRSIDCPLPKTANLWRIGGDIGPKWNSVLRLVDINTGHEAVAGPGAWNDMDMLEVGNGMNELQDRAHFAMWCIMASPLVAGNDVRTMTEATRLILTNKYAIAINQDPLGRQAALVTKDSTHTTVHAEVDASGTQVWAKLLSSPAGSIAIALLNRGSAAVNITANFAHLQDTTGAPHTSRYEVLDIWSNLSSLGVHANRVTAAVPGESAAFYKLIPKSVLV